MIELGLSNIQNNGSTIIPEIKISTDRVLNQPMKQNKILMNLLSLKKKNNANSETKAIPVLNDLNKTIPSFLRRRNN